TIGAFHLTASKSLTPSQRFEGWVLPDASDPDSAHWLVEHHTRSRDHPADERVQSTVERPFEIDPGQPRRPVFGVRPIWLSCFPRRAEGRRVVRGNELDPTFP